MWYCIGAAAIGGLIWIVAVIVAAQPPTWYEDVPPKNWNGVDDE